ncbi:MAG: hypothetical protein AB7E72_10905 [Lysobacterales bacterium]
MNYRIASIAFFTATLGACASGGSIAVKPAAAPPGVAPAPAAVQQNADLNGPFETVPRMLTSELAPGLDLTGPGYRISTDAAIVDYYGQFEMRSDMGTLTADGTQELRLRVRELPAVRTLDQVTTTEVFTDAVSRGVEKPADAVQQVATQPKETLAGLPEGIGRFLVRSARNIKDLALDINDAAVNAREKSDTEEEEEAAVAQERRSARAQKIATSATLNYIGYNKARREIAREVGADPYSTNPLLDERLDRLAWASWSGAKLSGLTIGLIGGVAGQALGYARDAYRLVWELPPEDLKRRNLEVLADLGIAGKPARDLVRRSKAFTLTQQTEFVELLRLPLFAPARGELFDLALAAEREIHARFLIDAMRMLKNVAEDEHRTRAQATVIGASPALRLRDGSYVMALPVDYLYWSPEIAQFVWRDDLIGRRNRILVTGSVSPQALDAFSQAGWIVRERIDPYRKEVEEEAAQTAPLRGM